MKKCIPSNSPSVSPSVFLVVCIECGKIYDHNVFCDFCPVCFNPLWNKFDPDKNKSVVLMTGDTVRGIISNHRRKFF